MFTFHRGNVLSLGFGNIVEDLQVKEIAVNFLKHEAKWKSQYAASHCKKFSSEDTWNSCLLLCYFCWNLSLRHSYKLLLKMLSELPLCPYWPPGRNRCPQLGLVEEKKKKGDCFGDQNLLCCVSALLIHCPTSPLPTGVVQGMACFLVCEWELELCSSDCEFWLLVLGDRGSPVLETEPTARRDRAARAVYSLCYESKGKLVASESYMPGCKIWWRVTDLPPILSALLPG